LLHRYWEGGGHALGLTVVQTRFDEGVHAVASNVPSEHVAVHCEFTNTAMLQ
jgi:hypothetical protein